MDYELWTIGPIGEEEGKTVILYQCPRCKTVVLNTGFDTQYCDVCKLREKNASSDCKCVCLYCGAGCRKDPKAIAELDERAKSGDWQNHCGCRCCSG